MLLTTACNFKHGLFNAIEGDTRAPQVQKVLLCCYKYYSQIIWGVWISGDAEEVELRVFTSNNLCCTKLLTIYLVAVQVNAQEL